MLWPEDACRLPEPTAARICVSAIDEGRAAELLVCLMDGGSATVDRLTGKLVLVSEDLLAQFSDGE